MNESRNCVMSIPNWYEKFPNENERIRTSKQYNGKYDNWKTLFFYRMWVQREKIFPFIKDKQKTKEEEEEKNKEKILDNTMNYIFEVHCKANARHLSNIRAYWIGDTTLLSSPHLSCYCREL